MDRKEFSKKLTRLRARYEELVTRPNRVDEEWYNGCFERYVHPVLTNEHVPLEWRYDLNPETNPYLMERLGVNAVFNAGAIELDGRICLVCRVEGNDRKSFFAVADSETGIDGFRFREKPILLPELAERDTNVYDMRLTRHEDGWIYGLFCSERKDPAAPKGDESAAVAACGIVRTRDLEHWERLNDLVTPSPQQRNVVLHPEFVNGKYAFYTRPQDGFIDAGTGGGIGWGLSDSIEQAKLDSETIVDRKIYHTIKEVKNGEGPAPIRTEFGWLHLAHGVRNCAAGMRYVLYLYMTSLEDPSKVIASPGGYFLAPKHVIDVMERLKFALDLHTSTFTQLLTARCLEKGLMENHLPEVRQIYKMHAEVMLEALEESMPKHSEIRWTKPRGGMFIWLTLPKSIDAVELLERCLEAPEPVAFFPGIAFYATEKESNTVRLSFVTVTPERIRTGIRTIAECLESMLKA